MKHFIFIFSQCCAILQIASAQQVAPSGTPSLHDFKHAQHVMVVAHRGDWRNAPENSLLALEMAIDQGVDMVEIDLAMSRDSVLFLMHDKTIDRTTTGTGLPADYTWEQLQAFNLRDGLGVATQMKIPCLEAALKVCKGRVFLNLDKGYDYIKLVYPILVEADMLDMVLFKGAADYKTVRADLGKLLDSIHYMPIVRLEKGEGEKKITPFMSYSQPFGFEFTVGEHDDYLLDFALLREQSFHVWVNSLWHYHNAGHEDDRAIVDPNVYQWYLDQHINIIQTDRPTLLLNYLRNKGLHD